MVSQSASTGDRMGRGGAWLAPSGKSETEGKGQVVGRIRDHQGLGLEWVC